MKTLFIAGIITISIIFISIIIFFLVKRENYNALSPDWKWNSLENSKDSYPEKCIAKPNKFFRKC